MKIQEIIKEALRKEGYEITQEGDTPGSYLLGDGFHFIAVKNPNADEQVAIVELHVDPSYYYEVTDESDYTEGSEEDE